MAFTVESGGRHFKVWAELGGVRRMVGVLSRGNNGGPDTPGRASANSRSRYIRSLRELREQALEAAE